MDLSPRSLRNRRNGDADADDCEDFAIVVEGLLISMGRWIPTKPSTTSTALPENRSKAAAGKVDITCFILKMFELFCFQVETWDFMRIVGGGDRRREISLARRRRTSSSSSSVKQQKAEEFSS